MVPLSDFARGMGVVDVAAGARTPSIARLVTQPLLEARLWFEAYATSLPESTSNDGDPLPAEYEEKADLGRRHRRGRVC